MGTGRGRPAVPAGDGDPPPLLERSCRLALQERRWGEALRYWQMFTDAGGRPDPALWVAIAEAFIRTGQPDTAQALLDAARLLSPGESDLVRMKALLAEARGNWHEAADIWFLRAEASRNPARRNNNLRAVRALLAAGDTDRAEASCRALLQTAPDEGAYLRLHAEAAIGRGDWVAALERWQRLGATAPDRTGPLPPDWVLRIGLDKAQKQTGAIRDDRLRATGRIALAEAIRPVDELAALRLARAARVFHRGGAVAMVARILADNARHGAAIWWLERPSGTVQAVSHRLPLLVESLLESSQLDRCEALLAQAAGHQGQDTLWLRAMAEIHYRRGDVAAMQALMQAAADRKLPVRFRSVQVTGWLLELIRHHPDPPGFLPREIRDLTLRLASLYDSKPLQAALELLLDPARGEARARAAAARIDEAARGRAGIDPVARAEMLDLFTRRRDWAQVGALLDLPRPGDPDAQSVARVWQLIRATLDFRLGQGDVAGAETVALEFMDRLAAAGLDIFALNQTRALLFRLPLSEPLAGRLQAIARQTGFPHLAERITDWRERYGRLDPMAWAGRARRGRCFIVGNAPSIGGLPLAALEGEDIFCVNRGLRARAIGLPAPRYLVVADPHVYKSHAREIEADGAAVEAFFATARCLWQRPPRVPAIPLGLSGLKLSLAPFRHAPLHLHPGESVVVLAAQLAHLMGYHEINIIGVDLDYAGPATHFYGGGRKESARLASFRPGGAGAEMVNLALASLQTAVAADGCRLRNAGPGGRLDSLERVDFHALLGQDRPDGPTTI